MVVTVIMRQRSHGNHVENVWRPDVSGDPDYLYLDEDEKTRLARLPTVTFFDDVKHRLTRRKVPCFYTSFTLHTYVEARI